MYNAPPPSNGVPTALKGYDVQQQRLQWLDAMRQVIDNPSPSRTDLELPIVQGLRAPARGVLSQLGQLPDSTNVALKDNFRKVFTALFSKTEVFEKQTDFFNAIVMDYQLYLMKLHYQELVDYCLWECTGRPVGLTHTRYHAGARPSQSPGLGQVYRAGARPSHCPDQG